MQSGQREARLGAEEQGDKPAAVCLYRLRNLDNSFTNAWL